MKTKIDDDVALDRSGSRDRRDGSDGKEMIDWDLVVMICMI
jgi:hypothetical protein